MNLQFNVFVEPLCFTTQHTDQWEMPLSSPKDVRCRSNLFRKLSFREGFGLSNGLTEESDDSLTNIFFINKREVTHIPEHLPKTICVASDSEKDHWSDTPLDFIKQQTHSIRQTLDMKNLPLESNPYVNQSQVSDEMMDEESQETIAQETCNHENFFREKLNSNNEMISKNFILNSTGQNQISQNSIQSLEPIPLQRASYSFPCYHEKESPNKSRTGEGSLITTKNNRDPDLSTIAPKTLVDLMKNPLGRKFLVIDCRYEYEYFGGHIRDAINITSPEELEELFIKNKHLVFNDETLMLVKRDYNAAIMTSQLRKTFQEEDISNLNPPILIFYCEFSQKRGPRGLRMLRKLDRILNYANWPNLYYPEIFLLENGYKNFHSQYPEYCDPKDQYIRMIDKAYKIYYAEAKMKDRKVWKKNKENIADSSSISRSKLQRFKTMSCI